MVKTTHNILIMAFRYALGRKTFAPTEVTESIKENIDDFPLYAIDIMIKEINNYMDMFGINALGDDCDIQLWLKFRDYLCIRKEKINAL